MQASGDTAAWDAMSHQECEYCANRSTQAKKIQETGAVFTGGSARVRVLHTYARDALTGIWPIDVRMSEEPAQIASSSGDVQWQQERVTNDFRVEVGQRDGAWVIVGVVASADVPQ